MYELRMRYCKTLSSSIRFSRGPVRQVHVRADQGRLSQIRSCTRLAARRVRAGSSARPRCRRAATRPGRTATRPQRPRSTCVARPRPRPRARCRRRQLSTCPHSMTQYKNNIIWTWPHENISVNTLRCTSIRTLQKVSQYYTLERVQSAVLVFS